MSFPDISFSPMQKNSSVVWFVFEIRRRFHISAREFVLPYLHIGDICKVLPNKNRNHWLITMQFLNRTISLRSSCFPKDYLYLNPRCLIKHNAYTSKWIAGKRNSLLGKQGMSREVGSCTRQLELLLCRQWIFAIVVFHKELTLCRYLDVVTSC